VFDANLFNAFWIVITDDLKFYNLMKYKIIHHVFLWKGINQWII
jgi:hypothetical protein